MLGEATSPNGSRDCKPAKAENILLLGASLEDLRRLGRENYACYRISRRLTSRPESGALPESATR